MQSDDIDCVYDIEMSAHKSPWDRQILLDCLLVGYDCRVLEIKNEEPEIVSYIMCRYVGDVCHILNLCVAPAHQKHGYGYYLLQQFIDSLTSTEINLIVLEVRPTNMTALSLYKKLGFEHVRIKRGYYRDPDGIEDAIVLQKSLGGIHCS